MLRLAADENFNNDIIRGLLRREPGLEIIRIQDVGLLGADDPTVLAWAATNRRVLMTHDVSTITKYAYDRIESGLPMPGVFEVSLNASLGQIITDLLLLATLSLEDEWENRLSMCHCRNRRDTARRGMYLELQAPVSVGVGNRPAPVG